MFLWGESVRDASSGDLSDGHPHRDGGRDPDALAGRDSGADSRCDPVSDAGGHRNSRMPV
jgi:hypothetical protein